MLRFLHVSIWPSLTTRLSHPSLPRGLQGFILYGTKLLYIGSSKSSYVCSSMWRGPQDYIAYKFVPTFPAMSRMSGSSNLDSLMVFVVGGRTASVCGVLPPGLVQYSPQPFSIHLISIHVVHPYSSIETTAAWKKLRFILTLRSDFHMTNSLSIDVHTFTSRVLMSFSVNETLLPR